MRAVVKTHPESGFVETMKVPIPKIDSDEVLVKIHSTGICGTDVLLADWTYVGRKPVPTPLILGHEGAGEIAEIGGNIQHLQVGDRVGIESIFGCGNCHYCRRGLVNLCPDWDHLGISFDGTFAEYVKVPASGIRLLPENISYKQAAFLEPISIVAHAMETNPVTVGDTVAIIGPGPFGLFTLQAVKSAGAGKVIMVGTSADEKRLEIAKKLGANYVIDRGEEDVHMIVKELTNGIGADVVFEAGGSPKATEQAIKMACGGGKVILMGFTTKTDINPLVDIVRQDLNIRGVVASQPKHYETTMRWLENGLVKVEPIITHTLDFEEANEGFELMKEKNAGKILFRI